MTHNNPKIQGKFYPLQHEEFLNACHQLAPAQLMVLYFLRTLDPYGDGVEVSISEIARRLSSENKEVHRSTVSRALKALDEKGFIDLELLKVKIKVSPRGLHCCDETTTVPTDNTVASPQQARSPRNKRDRHATRVASPQQARSSRNTQEPEPLPDNEPEAPKTIKSYSDFKDSLSEDERESFLKFARKKVSQLPNPPGLPFKWIEKHWEELCSQWRETQNEKENQKTKYNFEAYREAQHQMFYRQLQIVVKGAIAHNDDTSLRMLFKDDFYISWLNWASEVREDVCELLANYSVLQPYVYS